MPPFFINSNYIVYIFFLDFLSQGQLVTGTSKAWLGNVGELAKASHSHAAGDITSGTLATSRLPTVTVAKGGTGATTAAAARTNLGITLANLGAAASSHTHTKAQITDFPTTMTPTAHTHAAGDITSGTLPRSRGGLGRDADAIPAYAILRNSGANYDYIHYTATANGALYATAANGLPKFGTLPVAQGGTGVTSLDALKTALGISDSTNAKIKYYITDESYDEATIECGFYPVCIISNTSSDPLPAIGFRGSDKAYYLNQTGNTTFVKTYTTIEWYDTSIYISRTTCCIVLGY